MQHRQLHVKGKKLLAKTAPHHIILLELCIGLLMSISSLWLFAEIADEVLEQETYYLDIVLSQAIYDLRTPWLNDAMQWITMLGAEFVVLGSVVLFLVLVKKLLWKKAALMTSILGLGFVLNILLKLFYQRPRPSVDPLLDLSSYSFPSGHSMNAFIFYAVLVYCVYYVTKKKGISLAIGVLCAGIVLLVGFSRVYLGVHYPSDVIAGFIAGFFVFITAFILDHSVSFFRPKNK